MLDLIPEQWNGAAFLAGRRVAMLADRVGFGKTAQLVAACELVQARRVLVICPPNLRHNEIAEFERWAGTRRGAFVFRKAKDEIPPGTELVSCSYDLAPTVAAKLKAFAPDVLALDEAHALKTHDGVRTKAVLGAGGIASAARRVWFLTGTPNPNHAGEWYSFAKACGAWTKNRTDFVKQFCVTVPVWKNGYPVSDRIVGSKNQDQLQVILAPYVLARDGVDAARPPLTVTEFACDAAAPDLSGVDPAELAAIEEAIEAGDLDSLRNVSPEAVTTVRRLVGLAKAESVAALVRADLEADPASKAIVFAEYTATINIIAEKLASLGIGIIDGRTPPKDRETLFSHFRPNAPVNTTRVLICHRRSAGEGQTLTEADAVYLAEPSWTPDDNTQMIARAWRRGQQRPVRAVFCYLPGSIDAAVARTVARKARDTATLKIGETRK